MALRLRCPAAGCGKMLQVSEAARGRTIRCPACRTTFIAAEPVGDAHATRYGLTPPAADPAAAHYPDDPNATRYPNEPAGDMATPPIPPPTPPLFPSIPGYQILGKRGEGGMGVVYKARQVGLNRIVALKMILADRHDGADDRERFRAESEAVARLQHPNIVQIYDVGEHEGKLFFSMEFCAGGLDRKLNGTPLPPAEAAALMETLARAVHAAHQQHVVHRDLKPANVLLTTNGAPKVSDFGLAKRLDKPGGTVTGVVMGTPPYMALEQAGGAKDVGPAADVYALGAILYECLTGRPPFRGATAMETLLQVIREEPVPPRDLETICLKCLQKDPKRRYGGAGALADDLRRFLDGRPVGAVGRPACWWALLRTRIGSTTNWNTIHASCNG